VRVEEKPDPVIEHPNDATVRVTLAAICGSDLHLYHGMMPDTRVGMTFGHHSSGSSSRWVPRCATSSRVTG
jgi:S-(hydroxymethyl)glutathione dehydrogenase / alcohol dehydrogenase